MGICCTFNPYNTLWNFSTGPLFVNLPAIRAFKNPSGTQAILSHSSVQPFSGLIKEDICLLWSTIKRVFMSVWEFPGKYNFLSSTYVSLPVFFSTNKQTALRLFNIILVGRLTAHTITAKNRKFAERKKKCLASFYRDTQVPSNFGSI